MKGWDSNTIERLKVKGLIKKSSDHIPIKEDDIQRQCFAWFDAQYPQYINRCFHIPNGEKRDKKTVVNRRTGKVSTYSPSGVKLKKMGARKGVWDIFLSVPRKRCSGLFIEMKAGKNWLTYTQAAFRDANINDYLFVVCHSLDEFINAVNEYLK